MTVRTVHASELLRRCTYTGCDWQGDSEAYALHAKSCPFRPKGLILQELEEVRAVLCCGVLYCATAKVCCVILYYNILDHTML
jgi:hypothetical protein